MRRPVAVAIYALLAKLLPARFRSRAGAGLEDLFVWQLDRVQGRRARARFFVGALVDLVGQSVALRLGRGATVASPGRFVIEPVVRDARLAVRSLVRQPSFTLPLIVTLGLGIGMAAAMVAVVRGVLLRPLPYPDDDRVVVVRERTEHGGLLAASYMNFADWRESGRTFDALSAVVGPRHTIVLGGAEAVRVPALFVSADYFHVAGVPPVLGRPLNDDENRPGGIPAVVVSHRFWSETLGGRRDLAGAALTVQDLFGRIESYAVVGVMPASFDFMGASDVYLPLDRAVPWNVRGNHVVNVVGRLASGASLESAARDLDRVQAGIQTEFRGQTEAIGVGIVSLREEVVGSVRTPVLLLLIGALLLLATSFLNASGALLARGVVRRREFGVRISLGATRGRLLTQLILESAFYATGGLVLGLLIARGLLGLLSAAAPPEIPRIGSLAATWPELLAASAALVTVGLLLFGVATAALSTRGDPALRNRSGSTTRGVRTIWGVLIAAEVALALMLLATAGVLGRSLHGIVTADTGFETTGILSAEINLPPRPDRSAADVVRYFDTMLEDLRAMPGIESAGLSNVLPLAGSSNIGGRVQLESGDTPDVSAQYRVADAGFFETLGIGLVGGRVFDQRDVAGADHATVINTTMAELLFPGVDPIGRRFHLGGMDPYRDDWLTIVGIVEEARPWTAAPGSYPVYYVDYRQRPAFLAFTAADVVVRTRGTMAANDLRVRLAAIDADVPVRIRPLDERMSRRTADRRFVLTLLVVFALLALALTAVGIWGVVSFVASRRIRDMGIRLALGATPDRVARGLQWETGPPVFVGIVVGVALAGSLTRLVRSHLYGVGVVDPLSLTAVAVTILLTAWGASFLPARRVKRLDPVDTLRDS